MYKVPAKHDIHSEENTHSSETKNRKREFHNCNYHLLSAYYDPTASLSSSLV